jgi:hypothetical protein
MNDWAVDKFANGAEHQGLPLVGKEILVGQAFASYPGNYGTDDFHYMNLSQVGDELQVACNRQVSAWNDSILLVW